MPTVSRGFRCSALRRRHTALDRDEAIRTHRYGIDAAFDKEGSKFGVVARCLTAQADMGTGLVRTRNDTADHPLYGVVLFIEKRGKIGRVTVHAQRQLRQIVAAN